MGTDINVTCAGREIVVAISGDYIQRNLEWLDSGNKLSLSDYSCKAVQDKSGNRIIRIRDDFTKCGNRITTEVSKCFEKITKVQISTTRESGLDSVDVFRRFFEQF